MINGNLRYLLISTMIVLTFWSCKNDTAEPVRIGATMSLSGAYSTQGIAAANGYELCAEKINEQGGILGRNVKFLIYDDQSNPEKAVELYEKLISEDGVDAVMGPYGSTLTEAVAPITERHKMVQVSPLAATTSIWEQGREYLFMVLPPAELFLAGLIDMADEHGFKNIAILQEDALFPKAAGNGAAELAVEAGMNLVFHKTYPSGTEDFSSFLNEIKVNEAEVLGMAASSLDNFITVVRQMNELDVNVKMFGTSGAVQQFRDDLGELAEYAYGLSAWEPSLPNPGVEEFVAAYLSKYDMEPSFHAAGGYGSCELFAEAINKAGSLDQNKIREILLDMETTTVFSNYAVDERGYQIANQGVFIQWQDGEKVVVWPGEFASGTPRIPAPDWNNK